MITMAPGKNRTQFRSGWRIYSSEKGQRAISATASDTSITIELDKADYEALSRKARLTGNRVVDVIHTAVQREIGNKPHVITLMHRWNLHREDLDTAAESLGVDQLSETEWDQIGIRRSGGVEPCFPVECST